MDAVDLPHSDHGPRSALAVILLHGFPLDHRMWRFQRAALEEAGFRVIVPDLRGAGKAPLGRGPATMREHAADVLRLAERAGVRRFALVGFSMGGYVALETCRQLAAQAPDHLAGLLLIDSRAEPDTDEARAGRMATAEKVRAQGASVVADAMMPKMLTKDATPQLADEVRAMMLSQRPEGIVLALGAMASRPDARPTLQALRAPFLAVAGAEDPITPPEASKAMAALVPGGRHVVIPGAAHLAPMERADAVNAAIVPWLRALRP